jgi:hypothetical protein
MITAERACAIFLEMPVVVAGNYHGYPDFRVNNKMFATIPPGRFFANLKVGKEEQFMLSTRKKVFSIPEGGERGGWIGVRLTEIDEAHFTELVWKAWRNTAPPRLSLEY